MLGSTLLKVVSEVPPGESGYNFDVAHAAHDDEGGGRVGWPTRPSDATGYSKHYHSDGGSLVRSVVGTLTLT